jgi:hypothetical protein
MKYYEQFDLCCCIVTYVDGFLKSITLTGRNDESRVMSWYHLKKHTGTWHKIRLIKIQINWKRDWLEHKSRNRRKIGIRNKDKKIKRNGTSSFFGSAQCSYCAMTEKVQLRWLEFQEKR